MSSSTGLISSTPATTSTNIDVASIVSGLLQVDAQPLTTLNNQISSFQSKISALGTVQSALGAFQSASQTLSSTGNLQTYAATSSDPTVFTATASNGATPGSYAISVTQLAQAQTLVTSGQASATASLGSGGGQINLTINGVVRTVAISTGTNAATGSANDSLTGIANAINSAGIGVNATILNDGTTGSPYRLVLTATNSGTANEISQIAVTGEAVGNSVLSNLLSQSSPSSGQLTQTIAAQDASLNITVNGMVIPVSSSSNTVSPASLPGVTLTLNGTSSTGSTQTLTVGSNTNAITTAINTLVTSYNTLQTTISGLNSYNASTKSADLMQGDFGLTLIQSQIRAALDQTVSNAGGYSSLSQIGVVFQKDGSLAINQSVLNQAVSSNPAGVTGLFSTSSSTGLGDVLNTLSSNLLSANGVIANETSSFNNQIKAINQQENALNASLAVEKTTLTLQYSALDAALSSMNTTSSYLTQMLSQLP
jgi:flagellar hook-associated protein 2